MKQEKTLPAGILQQFDAQNRGKIVEYQNEERIKNALEKQRSIMGMYGNTNTFNLKFKNFQTTPTFLDSTKIYEKLQEDIDTDLHPD